MDNAAFQKCPTFLTQSIFRVARKPTAITFGEYSQYEFPADKERNVR